MDPLAELELHHSRPIAPTRRIALGRTSLPTDPAPGPGGVLLGGICATFGADIPEDMAEGVSVLTTQLQEGHRIVQPRLRHRFQEDRVGLATSQYLLVQTEDGLAFDFDHQGSPLQAIGAVYAAGRLPTTSRRTVMDAIRKGLRWGGAVDRRLIAHLSGFDQGRNWSPDVYKDPVQWALSTLGLEVQVNGEVHLPDRKEIQRRFREALRDAHPDHGGAGDDAAQRIADLTEARKILLS